MEKGSITPRRNNASTRVLRFLMIFVLIPILIMLALLKVTELVYREKHDSQWEDN